MTKRGELMTIEGEFKLYRYGVQLFNRTMGRCYSIDTAVLDKMEIKMRYPSDQVEEVYHMIFVLKGSLQIINSRNNLQNRTIGANQHNLYRNMPDNTVVFKYGIDDEVMCINLDQGFINRYLPMGHPVRAHIVGEDAQQAMTIFIENMPITAEVNAVLQQLLKSSPTGFSEQLLMESKAIELFALQLLQFERLGAGIYKLEDTKLAKMKKVKDIIIGNTGKQLSLKTLAHMVGTNEFDLKRDFKLAFGNTVYGYLKNHKMEQAKTMLTSNGLTVAEIGQKMGYKHATHFTSAFKKHFGYLPNKLRNTKLVGLLLLHATNDIISCLEPMVAL